jgi:MFS superfamily sulfate permease-like transporter
VAVFPFLLERIPIAALAGILVYTGVRLVSPHAVAELRKFGWSEVAIYLITLTAVVTLGLLEGVLIGVLLAAAKLLYTFSHLTVRTVKDPVHGRTILYLEGAATFIRLPQLAAALEAVPPSTELHVHLERLTYVDHACLDLLINWEKQHESTGGSLVIDWDSLTAKFRQPVGANGRAGPATGLRQEPADVASAGG